MRVVIAGGGTAGHVNPALALAEELDGEQVVFVGTAGGMEARSVPRAGFRLDTIDVSGLDRGRPSAIPRTLVRAGRAVLASRRLLKKLDPDVVVGMGGYVSLPVCLAARSTGAPVVLHEQNIVLGLANRACKRVSRKVAVSFSQTLAETGAKGIHTGNPVSAEIAGADLEAERAKGMSNFDLDPGRKTLLVFGGSLGAERLNRAAVGLAKIWKDRSDLQVLHICGRDRERDLMREVATVDREGLNYRLIAYVEEMVQAYAVADLCLCRGGATTVAELTCVGRPSIIVPYPFHRDRQQERHGRVLEDAGAALVLADSETTTERVSSTALNLLEDPNVLGAMAAAAARLGRPGAATALAQVVREVGS